ncbi:probable glycerol-3-phosphate dehydrogenase, mitochondrial [Drosophila bipectinata]|uniref:probable glycerol-3-phosphate dehydrogenase, mitochondrial n=1 Tax=Drosophila bipectinata TaxID=42026 RepID=UPI001C8A2E91|nr:probable glycerol-3-phosphate dehydrogenase, mitochondrial [Drosophila bipectinata]
MLSKLCVGFRPLEVRYLIRHASLLAHHQSHHLRFRPRLRFRLRGIVCREDHCCAGQKTVPSREEHIATLKGEEFDVLVIGGGAVGCGCAVDAACRGLKTALVEADDFASGVSSRSTKLIDGVGSYLAALLQKKDLNQLYIMVQMMNERATMLKIAPHLNRVQPMLIPSYSVVGTPLTWLALKIYDFISAHSNVRASHFVSKEKTLYEFPLLKTEGLRGGIVYYDGQMDDARMCIALTMTAVCLGASVANHTEVVEMVPQDGCCRVVGVKDKIADETFYIQARAVINATGTSTDFIRKMDEETTAPILLPSVGTHVTLPRYFGSSTYGLLSPSKDKKDPTIVMVPFENHTLLGVREVELDFMESSKSPSPDPEDVDCLLDTARERMAPCVELERFHVLSAWTGLRPSVSCPSGKREEEEEGDRTPISSYMIEVSKNGLITLAGGRWSTYRVMAAHAVDMAIETCDLCDDHVTTSYTDDLELDGAQGYCCMLPLELVQDYGVPMDVAQHISDSYGYNGHALLSQAPDRKGRLHPSFPYIEAEVQYAVRNEYACTLVDIIARRLRVAFVDAAATLHMLPKILKVMAEEKEWQEEQATQELLRAQEFLVRQMGLGSIIRPKSMCPNKQEPRTKSTPEGCCCNIPKRKECRSFSSMGGASVRSAASLASSFMAHPASTPSVSKVTEKPLPITSGITTSSVESTSRYPVLRASVSKVTAPPLAFTSGITHTSVESSSSSEHQPNTRQRGWIDRKKEIILKIWRNKFMC